ncbi:16S rRNA (guanine(527)-N(7))-methyltransferase RsmG [Erysipelothrix urinaevulpis]|uniref:16S rRNA (guanine(527)-N(7))-methyltransferase RsmG n=1 Tax=Erysipelothrix urinaevulpis TaxID=2683717 RepID=UPI00135829DE|nr:16S rRNA (guanine(527)-N(7))-methyltransferase RsmG [Erysipelothrix urinaevulpis]
MDFEAFIKSLESMEIVVSELMRQQFLDYKNLIQEVNKVLNLTGIDDDEGIYLKHFWDSLLISPMIPKNARVCDVGSGAGFPGIVLAIARPDITIVCVEPTKKRTDFLERVVSECNLTNVKIINDRAEHVVDDYREHFDVVTARAVAHLDILSELCVPLLKINGTFIAMKGMRGLEEVDEAKKALTLLALELENENYLDDEGMGVRYNLEFTKKRKTPKKYPRTYAKIKKTPLSGRL